MLLRMTVPVEEQMTKIVSLAFAITMALVPVTGAKAAAYTLGDGTLGPGDAGIFGIPVNVPAPPGVISDTYSFVATSLAQIATIVSSLEFFGPEISGLSVQLFQGDPTDGFLDALVATGAQVMGNSDLLSMTYANLQPAGLGYYLLVGGTAGSNGGIYTGAYNLSVVPIPAAMWLFATALVGLAGVARRRRSI